MFATRLREAMKKAGVTHHVTAKAIGKSRATIAHWVLGNRTPSSKDIAQLATFLGVDPNYLLGADSPAPLKGDLPLGKSGMKTAIHVPVLGGVAGCGASGILEQLEDSEETIVVDRKVLPDSGRLKDFASIRIVGDSMEPYLEENDWAIIHLRRDRDIAPINGVYLIAVGENVHIKRCSFQSDGSCLLLSDNQLYPPEKAASGEWNVLGKIIGRIKIGAPLLFR